MNDIPNFKMWEKDDLADFAKTSYLRMQESQEEIETLRLDIMSIIKELQDLRKILVDFIDPL